MSGVVPHFCEVLPIGLGHAAAVVRSASTLAAIGYGPMTDTALRAPFVPTPRRGAPREAGGRDRPRGRRPDTATGQPSGLLTVRAVSARACRTERTGRREGCGRSRRRYWKTGSFPVHGLRQLCVELSADQQGQVGQP